MSLCLRRRSRPCSGTAPRPEPGPRRPARPRLEDLAANKETNTYGGIYVWQDCEAMEASEQTEIFKGMVANPHLGGSP